VGKEEGKGRERKGKKMRGGVGATWRKVVSWRFVGC